MSAPRPLEFPLNYALSLTSLVEDGADSFTLPQFPTDSDERTTLLLNLSLREFVALATAIDVGSDIAYGDEAVAIWWLWTRSIMSETLCEKIAQCINTSEAVRDAIGDIFTSDIDTPQYEQLLEKLREDLEQTISPVNPTDCNDSLWGACISFVEVLNRNALDYLELLETSPIDQTLELANNVANAPLLDEVGLDAITGTISWAIDQLFDYYVASYTDEYRDALACEVFCRVKNTCAISVNDFYEVLKERAQVSVLDPNDIVQVAVSLAQIVFSGASDRVVDVWFYWNLELARLGNTLANANGVVASFGFGNAMTRLKTQLKLGFNNPDSDWELLCDDCPSVPTIEIYETNGASTLDFDGTTYTLFVQAGTFASLRVIGADENNCDNPFRPENITVLSGVPTGREWRNCPSGTIDSANAPVTDAEGLLMSYYAVSASIGLGGTDFTLTFTLGNV